MSLTYGFFNSENGDRKYNADQMSEYFDGLVSNGVYENVGGALQVLASEGMAVNVESGRAIIDCKWANNSAALEITLDSAHPTYNRWDAIVVRLNYLDRNFEIDCKKGTPASEPTKPSMQRDATMYELCLAYIYVGAATSSILQSNIEDMRPSSLCGWVTGLIDQVDTSTLFLQWQTAYENYYNEMTADFDEWFEDLTEQLNVNTYIKRYYKRELLTSTSGSNVIALDMTGYTYDASDIIHVYINGLFGNAGVDYTLDTTNMTITTTATASGTEVIIEVLKSKIGFEVLAGSDGNQIVGSDNQNIEV